MARDEPPPRVLALLDHYLPGMNAGGPVRSIQHLGERLGTEYRFLVLTRNHDLGDPRPYPGYGRDRWHALGGVSVHYLPRASLGVRGIRAAIGGTPHDVLYLNSLFSFRFSVLPLLLRRIGAIPQRPVVLAPRGELHPGALATGSWGPGLRLLGRILPSPRALKKKLYVRTCRLLGLFDDILWQASSAEERTHVLRHVGGDARVMVAPDLGPLPRPEAAAPVRAKEPGRLRIVYLSRIVENKNLLGAVELLQGVRHEVELSIYGPAEDTTYWRACAEALRRLPSNVTARYLGAVPHARVAEILCREELLLLPTHGENFGHVILEALLEGCPVLVSDRTPWRELQSKGVGWDLALADVDAFRRAVEACAQMDPVEYTRLSRAAADYARRYVLDPGPVDRNRELFRVAAGSLARRHPEEGLPPPVGPHPADPAALSGPAGPEGGH